MWTEPVVEEVRAIRDEYARRFNYDIEAICRDLVEHEKASGGEIVTLPAERVAFERELPGDSRKKARRG